ncbi:MAG: extracellular solute-binding protein [Acetatifactor sp.]|nr:extracellular solute-binding protein [Acetatifactor sp.]
MKGKGEKLRARRIAVGVAGLAIVIAAGISLIVFTGQRREPVRSQEEQAVNGSTQSQGGQAVSETEQSREGQAVNEPTQPQEKQEVILWVMRASPLLKECVGNFNRGDHGYRVMIHECYSEEKNVSWEDALLRLQMALSRSTGPDIVLVESLDVNALAKQGMLEDLTPYFAGSGLVDQEDFLENVTASYTYDGKWIALPRWITIQTLWGNPGIVGDTPGWTVQEMLALAERYPEFSVTGHFVRWEFLNCCTTFVPETFWLEPDGGAKEELREMLEQAASYPTKFDQSRWNEECLQVSRGEALLTEQYVYKMETLLYLQEFAGEGGLIPIGYPTLDGSPRALLSPANGLYAIPANAPNKEGAWAVLELFFAGELDPREREKTGPFYQASGIPVCRQELEEEFQWELEDDLQRRLHRIDDMDEEQIAMIREWLEELIAMAQEYPSSARPFLSIIAEEGEFYFEGVKTLDETLRVIENRGSLYFQENADAPRGQ